MRLWFVEHFRRTWIFFVTVELWQAGFDWSLANKIANDRYHNRVRGLAIRRDVEQELKQYDKEQANGNEKERESSDESPER